MGRLRGIARSVPSGPGPEKLKGRPAASEACLGLAVQAHGRKPTSPGGCLRLLHPPYLRFLHSPLRPSLSALRPLPSALPAT